MIATNKQILNTLDKLQERSLNYFKDLYVRSGCSTKILFEDFMSYGIESGMVNTDFAPEMWNYYRAYETFETAKKNY